MQLNRRLRNAVVPLVGILGVLASTVSSPASAGEPNHPYAASQSMAGWADLNPLPPDEVHYSGVEIDPSAYNCVGVPNGTQHEYFMMEVIHSPDYSTLFYEIFTCNDGVLTITSKLCDVGYLFNSCLPIPPFAPTGPINVAMRVQGPLVTVTVTDITSGKSVTKKMKSRGEGVDGFAFGVTNVAPNGKVKKVTPFPTQALAHVVIDGAPIESYGPTALTLLDGHGRPAGVPSDLGEDGASFTVHYVGKP